MVKELDKNKITINIDFDDVLNNLSVHWKKVHYNKTGEILKVNSWDVHKYSKYGERIYDYFNEPTFFLDCDIRNGAYELISFIENNIQYFDYRILSSTNNKQNYNLVFYQKFKWLKNYFDESVANRLILTSKSKGIFVADIIIDDYYKNLLESTKSIYKILLRSEHNRLLTKEKLLKEYNLNCDIHEDLLQTVNFLNNLKNFGNSLIDSFLPEFI